MAQTRRMLVLRAIVEDYIRSQEPVGSTALAKSHDLGVSSATIRNDMATLEDEGYLIQPHTSAGRIPTEKGYRYFVDRLSGVVPLSAAQKRGISTFLSGSVNLQDTLQRAAKLLAQITGQIAVVASPSLAKATLRHVEIVPVSSTVLLIVVITDTGNVAQHTLAMSPLPATEILADVSHTINAQCIGMTFIRAAERVRSMPVSADNSATTRLLTGLANVFDAMGDNERASDLYMAGASHLAQHSDVDDLAPLFDALEEQVVLMNLMTTLSESTNAGGVGVAIGSETHTPGLLHASVVTSGYGRQANQEASSVHETHEYAASPDVYPQDDHHAQHTIPAYPTASDTNTHDILANTLTSGNESSSVSILTSTDLRSTENDSVDDSATTSAQSSTTPSAQPVAFVGSIGPTHMDYATTIAAVQAVARYLTASLSSHTGDLDVD